MKRGTLHKMMNTVWSLWTATEENCVGKKEGGIKDERLYLSHDG